MNNQFTTYRLGEVANIIAGGDKPKVFSLDKTELAYVPVLANAEKNNGLLGYTDTSRIIEPAVTLSARGSNVGFVAVRKEPFFPIVRLLSLIPDKERLDVDYLFYNLKQNRKKGTGSGQPQITIPDISGKTISMPSLSDQKKVAKVLSTLDEKIELNNRINTELEAMAKTLYDYWFVQFDFPDADGKPYKASGGKMVYNDTLKREIPDGWDWKAVSSLIEVRDGTHDSPKPAETGQYLVTSKHLKPSGIDFSDAYLISQEDFDAVNKRSKVDEGDFLLSMIGTVGISQWAMKIETPYAIKNIGLFKTSQAPEMADYIFAAVTSLYGKAYLQQNQSTGTSQPYVTLGTLRSIPILIPDELVFEQFNRKIKPIHKLMYENTTENQKLAQLRDWLLPMLMSGQVTVKPISESQEAQHG
ncbi:restriction endonuclease subunit S [Vibrio splendidus]